MEQLKNRLFSPALADEIEHSKVEPMISPSEIAEIYPEILSIRCDDIPYMKVSVNTGIFHRNLIHELVQPLFLGC